MKIRKTDYETQYGNIIPEDRLTRTTKGYSFGPSSSSGPRNHMGISETSQISFKAKE